MTETRDTGRVGDTGRTTVFSTARPTGAPQPPEPTTAAQQHFQERCITMWRHYDPDVAFDDQWRILNTFRLREDQLLEALVGRYGAEPGTWHKIDRRVRFAGLVAVALFVVAAAAAVVLLPVTMRLSWAAEAAAGSVTAENVLSGPRSRSTYLPAIPSLIAADVATSIANATAFMPAPPASPAAVAALPPCGATATHRSGLRCFGAAAPTTPLRLTTAGALCRDASMDTELNRSAAVVPFAHATVATFAPCDADHRLWSAIVHRLRANQPGDR